MRGGEVAVAQDDGEVCPQAAKGGGVEGEAVGTNGVGGEGKGNDVGAEAPGVGEKEVPVSRHQNVRVKEGALFKESGIDGRTGDVEKVVDDELVGEGLLRIVIAGEV